MSEKNKKEIKQSKLKKTIKNILAVVLIASISVAATLAYLSTTSTPINNVFTGSEGITLDLTEPGFDDDTTGKNYTPGKTFTKDPRLTNTSDDTNAKEWVAIMVCYELGGYKAKMSDLENVIYPITINGETDTNRDSGKYWEKIKTTDYYDIYIYNRTLVNNDTEKESTTLFDEVQILSEDDMADKGVYTSTTLPDFNIHVRGAAIKNEYTYVEGTGDSAVTKEPTTLSELNTKVSAEKLAEIEANLIAVLEKNMPTIVEKS